MGRYFLQDMADAYLECAYFTDVEENESEEVEFTSTFKNDAYQACCDFENACTTLKIDIRVYSPEQLGHDLWLTRNGHGAGFWDRNDETYPETLRKIFTALARAQGYHEIEFA